MFGKLYSRITESSLMEESIPTRYVFMVFVAIADPHGYVIGTDIALARRVNMPLQDFQLAVERLRSPDTDSNSKEQEGRRLVISDGERGYQITNFIKYRDMRNESSRREYMRSYVADYREQGKDKSRPVNNGKQGKLGLAQATATATANDKASGPTKATKLSKGKSELADRFEAALNGQWVNDAGKWITRIKSHAGRCLRIVCEIESASKEGRITTTPGQYAEHLWTEFT